MTYGIMFWGSSAHAHKVFTMQKKIIRIITNCKPRDSCREIFKRMKIMTLYSQYIYTLLLFIINNKNIFVTNNKIHEHKTIFNNNNLHLPTVNLTKSDKGAYIANIKACNHLPQSIKILVDNEKSSKVSLKRFL
jgi:hypothetical protein